MGNSIAGSSVNGRASAAGVHIGPMATRLLSMYRRRSSILRISRQVSASSSHSTFGRGIVSVNRRMVGKRKGHRCDAGRVVERVPSRGVLLAISCMGTPRCCHSPQEGEGDV